LIDCPSIKLQAEGRVAFRGTLVAAPLEPLIAELAAAVSPARIHAELPLIRWASERALRIPQTPGPGVCHVFAVPGPSTKSGLSFSRSCGINQTVQASCACSLSCSRPRHFRSSGNCERRLCLLPHSIRQSFRWATLDGDGMVRRSLLENFQRSSAIGSGVFTGAELKRDNRLLLRHGYSLELH